MPREQEPSEIQAEIFKGQLATALNAALEANKEFRWEHGVFNNPNGPVKASFDYDPFGDVRNIDYGLAEFPDGAGWPVMLLKDSHRRGGSEVDHKKTREIFNAVASQIPEGARVFEQAVIKKEIADLESMIDGADKNKIAKIRAKIQSLQRKVEAPAEASVA